MGGVWRDNDMPGRDLLPCMLVTIETGGTRKSSCRDAGIIDFTQLVHSCQRLVVDES